TSHDRSRRTAHPHRQDPGAGGDGGSPGPDHRRLPHEPPALLHPRHERGDSRPRPRRGHDAGGRRPHRVAPPPHHPPPRPPAPPPPPRTPRPPPRPPPT